MTFLLSGANTFTNVLAALAESDLRIGIKVQGFEDGGSESFISNPPVVPLPAAAWMGVVLLGGIGMLKKWRERAAGE
jgi:hypothetical protein